MKLSILKFLQTLLIFLLSSGIYCFGQSDYSTESSDGYFKGYHETSDFFKSPQTATLGTFGGFGVNYYTGRPDISIPLYTLNSKNLSLPLTLVYNSTGVKVSDISSWVGMNWELLSGGYITRDINNLPDETNERGYFYTASIVDNFCKNSNITKDWITAAQNKEETEREDSEPDLFYFNFLGKTGEFVFDVNNKPVSLSKDIIEIDLIMNENKLWGFMIITDDGTKFTFGTNDNAIEQIKISTLTIPFKYGFQYRYDPIEALCKYGKKKYNGEVILSWLDLGSKLDDDEIIIPSSSTSWYYSNSGSIEDISIITDDIEKRNFINSFVNNKWYLTKITAPDNVDYIEFTYNDIGEISYVTTPQVVSSIYKYSNLQTYYPDAYDETTWRTNTCIDDYPDKYYVKFGEVWSEGVWIDPDLVDNSSYDFHMALRTPNQNTSISQSKIFIKRKVLSRINTSSGHEISFQTSNNTREDLPGEVVLEKIIISSNQGILIKQIEFKYETFSSDYSKQNTIEDPLSLAEALMKKYNGDYVHKDFEEFIAEGLKEYNYKRLFLKSVSEKGSLPYEMQYKTDVYMPRRTSLMVNLYGFPRKYTDIATRKDKKIIFGFYPDPAGNFSDWRDIGNIVYTENSYFGILEKIKYPTGGYSVFEFEEHDSGKACGNKISKIIDYSSQQEISMIKEYKYEGLSYINNPVNSVEIDYCFPFQIWTESWYPYRDAYPYLFTYFHPLKYQTSFSLNKIETVQGSYVGYSKVTEYKRKILDENNLFGFCGYEEFYFNNQETDASFNNTWDMPFESDKKTDFRGKVGYPKKDLFYVPNSKKHIEKGLIDKHVVYNNMGAKLEETNYSYVSDPNPLFINGFVGHKQKWMYFDREWYYMNSTPGAVEKNWSFYLWGKYSYEINKSYISSIVKSSFDPNDINKEIISTTNYFYNTRGQIQSTTSFDSKGSELKQMFKYAYDYNYYTLLNFPDEPYARAIHILRYKNMINNPIETTTWKDNKLVSATLQLYQSIGKSILTGFKVFPYQTYQLNLTEPVSDFYPSRISYEGTNRIFKKDSRYKLVNTFGPYDDYGNILHVNKENNISKSYIWGYNSQYPIAEVVNAQNNEVFYTSFEGEENDLMSFVSNNCTSTRAHSGKKSLEYTLTNPSLSNWERRYEVFTWKEVIPELPKKYKYSGWVYSNGPKATVSLMLKRADGVCNSTLDAVTTKTNQWTYVEGEFNLPATYSGQTVTHISLYVYGADVAGKIWFDDLRLYPSDAQMTTYTYDPLVGITSVTGPDNRTTTYEYDDFGRLKCVKDNNGNVLEYYDYNYKE